MNVELVRDGRDILAALARRGIRVTQGQDGRLSVAPRGLVDECDMALLTAHRPAVRAVLEAAASQRSAEAARP